MTRLPDWKEHFYEALDAARGRTPEWGVHDCLQFPARIVLAITGEDPAAQFGVYSDEAGALALMNQYGGVSGILTHAFGEPTAPNFAGAGDLIVANIAGHGETGGVCNGTNCAFVVMPRGLIFLPRLSIDKVWKI